MPAIRIREFKGIAPKIHERNLPPQNAQTAVNCRLDSGVFKPIRSMQHMDTLSRAGQLNSIYLTDGDYWLQWNNAVSVVRGQISGDTTERLYYSGDGYPKATNATLLSSGSGSSYPNDAYLLGIPYPDETPGASLGAGGTGTARAVAYAFTLVSGWDEEGPPSSPSSIVNAKPGQTVNLSNMGKVVTITQSGGVATVAHTAHGYSTGQKLLVAGAGQGDYNRIVSITVTGVGAYTYPIDDSTTTSPATGTIVVFKVAAGSATGKTNITKIWVYRVSTGSTDAEYQYLTEVAIGTTTYADSTLDADLGDVLESTDWYPPPTDLEGLIAMPNGVMVGYSVYGLCFSEPYQPHAWPVKYRQKPDYPITGIALDGSNVVVGTEQAPYVAVGAHPSVMSMVKIPHEWACVSGRAIRSVGSAGVFYPCKDGLVRVTGGHATLYTAALFDRQQWTDLPADGNMHAVVYDDLYILFYLESLSDNVYTGGALVFNMRSGEAAPTELGFYPTAAHTDPRTGNLYVLRRIAQLNELYLFESSIGTLLGEWKSEKFNSPRPMVMAAARVSADYGNYGDVAVCETNNTAIIAANQLLIDNDEDGGALADAALADLALADDFMEELSDCGAAFDATFILYVGGELAYSKVVTDSEPFRLPPVRGRDFELYVSGSATVYELAVATTISELVRPAIG